jgi:hypothetical protein
MRCDGGNGETRQKLLLSAAEKAYARTTIPIDSRCEMHSRLPALTLLFIQSCYDL